MSVPDVRLDVEGGCIDIQVLVEAGQAVDSHYQVGVAEDIHKLEAVVRM